MAARFGHAEAVMALVKADRPGVVDAVRAAVCCRSSALVSMSNEVDAYRRARSLPLPSWVEDWTHRP